MEQIVEFLGQASLQILLTFGAVIAVTIIALFFFVLTEISGSVSKIEVTINAYNTVLSAWAAFAKQEELNNVYPLGVEIEADKIPFGGLHIKKSIVLVKVGFKEKRYRLVSRKNNHVHFVEEMEDEVKES